jgi:SAM-dependent methyltransferase
LRRWCGRTWWNSAERRALSPEQAETLEESELDGFRELKLGPEFYYYTAYGTPLAYARALDLAATHGFESADGRRILDFGFGGIGHLRLLASLGGHATGIEILELLRVYYRERSDTGTIPRSAAAAPGPPGALALVYGSFPGDAEVRRAVGDGYDLVVSKNVLKKGYVHPEREADPRHLVHLGVDDETFVRAVHDVLNPGGLFVIYNLYPAQAPPDEPYIPWATGGCPFERGLVESVGFEIVVLDRDDTEFARRMGEALGWADSMDLETELFAMYTVLRRPGD